MSEDYKEFEIKIPSIEKQKEIVEAIEKDLKNAKTEEEKARYEGALRRKQLSLILAGKMKPSEATELKKLFLEE